MVRLALALTALAATGCCTRFPERELTFQVVDATTLLPLEGVSVSHLGMNRCIGWRVFADSRALSELPPTGPDGKATASYLADNQVHYFYFEHPGYQEGHANWAAGRPEEEVLVDLPPDDPDHANSFARTPLQGVKRILMYKSP